MKVGVRCGFLKRRATVGEGWGMSVMVIFQEIFTNLKTGFCNFKKYIDNTNYD